MNKGSKFLFVSLTLLLLLVSVGSITAADNDSITTTLSDDSVSANHDTITSNTEKIVKTSQKLESTTNKDVKKTNKNLTKITQTDKQTKKDAVETTQTATDYETLKTAWNNVITSGNEQTEYTINIKNGNYKFEEELKTDNTTGIRHVTLNGEDVNQTIFNGQNKSRLFNLNNTKQIIKFNNITFTNGHSIEGGAIYINSNTTFNNTRFINNTVSEMDKRIRGGAISLKSYTSIYNSNFIDNHAFSLNTGASGGAIYCTSDLLIYNCSFINNSATGINETYGSGGVLYLTAKSKNTINITLCEFINNKVNSSQIHLYYGAGGAIYDNGYHGLNIENCEFYNNSANYGGAIDLNDAAYWNKGSTNILSSVFANNTATQNSPNIYVSMPSTIKANLGSIYYADNSEPSIIGIYVNGKKAVHTFNQKTKNMTIFCISNTDSYYGPLTFLGLGKSLNLVSSSNLINTTGLTFNPENEYSLTIDTSKLPAKFDNITLYVENIEAAKIVCDYTNVEFNNITAKPGEKITLNATYKTSDNKFIPDGKVAFKINGCTIGHSNIEFGTATLNYTIPSNYSSKDYILTTTYGGSSKFIEARTNATLHLEKLATKTNLTTSIEGNTLKITVDAKDENGNTVKDGKICVKIEGKTLQNLKINGKTTVNFTIPKSWNNREIKVLAIYGENNNHKQSRMEIKTKLVLPNTKTTKTDTIVNNYYVSANNGSDSNTGSQTSPFKTIQKAITTVTNNKQSANIYLDGQFKGVGNTNLTIPGDLHINFIGVGNSSIDGEVKYDYKYELEDGEYYWGSGVLWRPYANGTGNWAMTITKGEGLITISNFTIKNCWNEGGSSIAAYKTATVDNYGNLAVNNVSFIFNHGGVGASIRNNKEANLNVTNSLFEANRKASTTGNYGAGIYNNGTAIVINSTFQKNYARWGTITNDKNLTIINSTIRDNIGYDGGSAYDSGSSIAINTQDSNYFETISLTGITTVIDGCYFTNNDQIDIYADLGETTIINNVFNKSTGIRATGNKTLTFNITNNTIDSPIYSNIYTTLTNTNPYLITFKLSGSYKYIIDSNRVLNVNGTLSRALELTASNSQITNNNFTRMININGVNNTIKGNNITTNIDDFTIDLGDYKDNIIIENYFESKILKGNSAINYTSTTNKVENNTPEVQEIQVDDETFFKFFDDDGNLLDSYKNIEQIQIIGSLNNKNMNFNKEISVIQKGKFTSYNITITTTKSIEILSLNITNTNNEPVITVIDNSVIKNTNLQTNNNYIIILNGENNTVVNNTLLADILVGNESVKSDKINNITQNTPTYKNYVLSQENFDAYFNNDGTIKIENNDIHFLIDGTITNKDIIISNNKSVTITYYQNSKLANTTIKTTDGSSLSMTYMNIENTNDKTAIQLGLGDHKIEHCNITTKSNTIESVNSNILIIKYNNIKTIGTNNVNTISLVNLKNKTEILYNNILIKANSNATLIKAINNETQTRPGIEVGWNNLISNATNGKIVDIISYNITVVRNTITSIGEDSKVLVLTDVRNYDRGWRVVESNNITIDGKNSIGIIFRNNTPIILKSGFTYYPVESLIFNNMDLNRNNSIGVIVDNANNLSVSSNDINIYGDSSAVVVNNSINIKVKGNDVGSVSCNNESIAPVMISNSTQSNVTSCAITTTTKYSVIIDTTSKVTRVTDNTLCSEYLGDDSVLNLNMKYNEVVDNDPEDISYFHLNDGTYNKFFDNDGNLLSKVPEGITILATGKLYNKILNINKPINLVANGLTYINTTLNITGDNVNISGIGLEGNSKIILNASNCNIVINSISAKFNTNQTPVIISGYNNTFKIGIISVTCTNDIKLNITVIKITGNNHDISFSSTIETSNYDNAIGINLNNLYNTKISTSAIMIEGNNITSVLFNNSHNNTFRSNQLEFYATEDNKAIILNNSTYNKISARISTNSMPANEIVKLINNSNYNKIQGVNITGDISCVPIQIVESHYNHLFQNYEVLTNYIGHVINIKESVGNKVTYNILKTASLQGDFAVLQENMNDTVNNIVAYNTAGYLNNSRINMTLPSTAKIYDTLRINATVEYQKTSIYWDPYYPVEAGHIVFIVNGKEIGTVEVVDGQAEMNYTVKPTDKILFIELRYEDPTLVCGLSFKNTTVTIEKLDSKILVANTTNTGVNSKVTAIILDELGNIVYDGNVTFTLGDVNQTVTINNGITQATFDTSAYKPGEYNITATFNGNDICAVANNTVTLTVTPYDVNMIVDPITVISGNKVLLTANVTDVNGKAVNTGRVIFKLNGCTLKDANGNTLYANVINGTATVEYMIPAHYTAKNYTLTAVASSSAYNRTETNSTLTINKTTPKAQQIPLKVKRTNNTTITVKFTDNENNDLIGENKVCIKFNGKTLINTKATNGTVKVNLDLTNYKNSQYEFTVICGANSRYNTCKNVSTLILE